MPYTFRMTDDNELKSVDPGSWFHTLITLREKYSSAPVSAISFIKFEGVAACPHCRVPLKKVIEISNLSIVRLRPETIL